MTNRVLLIMTMVTALGTFVFSETVMPRVLAFIVFWGFTYSLYVDIKKGRKRKDEAEETKIDM
jgi:hypothetical protein